MSYLRDRSLETFWGSAFIGAFAGTALVLVHAFLTSSEPVALSELWGVPPVLLVYGFIATPFTALGLVAFAVPATALLRSYSNRIWVGFIAVVLGAITGRLLWYAVDHVIFLGQDQFDGMLLHPGVFYGVSTALAWWILKRRELAPTD